MHQQDRTGTGEAPRRAVEREEVLDEATDESCFSVEEQEGDDADQRRQDRRQCDEHPQ